MPPNLSHSKIEIEILPIFFAVVLQIPVSFCRPEILVYSQTFVPMTLIGLKIMIAIGRLLLYITPFRFQSLYPELAVSSNVQFIQMQF